MPNIATMLVLNDWSVQDMGATDVFNESPLLSSLDTIHANFGTEHKYRKTLTAPTSGFRTPGNGIANAAGTYANITASLDILDATFDWEKALADSHPAGADALLGKEAMHSLKQALKNSERQVLYGSGSGVDGAAEGFQGLADILATLAHAMVIEAGTPAAGQNLTDVFAIRSTDDEKFLNFVLGNSGQIAIGERYVQLRNGANDLPRNVYVQPMEAWGGVVLHSDKSAARLCNIDDSDSKLTDDKLAELYELFDENNPPTAFVMNKRSGRQLQQSRVATTPTGAYVPLPTEWEGAGSGVPIIYTNSVGYYTDPVPAS